MIDSSHEGRKVVKTWSERTGWHKYETRVRHGVVEVMKPDTKITGMFQPEIGEPFVRILSMSGKPIPSMWEKIYPDSDRPWKLAD